MTVVVKFHGQASPSLVAWQQRLLAKPPHDPRLSHILIDEMIRWFEKFDGLPPGSVFQSEPTRHYVARYSGDTWVHFKYKDADWPYARSDRSGRYGFAVVVSK